MRREDLYNCYIEIRGSDGTLVKLQCDKMSGIGMKAKSQVYRAANGLETEQVLGAPRKADPVTLTRLYDPTVDAVAPWLLSQCGRASVTVTKEPLDENGHKLGNNLIQTGKLDDFTTPGTDSESDKAALCMFATTVTTPVATA